MQLLLMNIPERMERITLTEFEGNNTNNFVCKIKIRVAFHLTKNNYKNRLKNAAAALELQEKIMALLNEYFEPTEIQINS
jgi:lysyl-tRNA synthetase class I